MTMLRRIALSTLLAVGLAACGDGETDGSTQQAAIAPIAAPAGQSWVDTATETPEGGILLGNPNAPIKLMEYGSLTCPACAAFDAEAGEAIKNKYVASGVVSFELRNQIHNAIDLALVKLTRCTGDATSVIPLSTQIWANLQQITAPVQQNPTAIEQTMALPEAQRFPALADPLGLTEVFAARGVPADQQRQCLSDFAGIQQIADRSNTQSEELDVTGTPTFFINGRNLGTLGWAELEANLQNAGAR